MKYFTSDTHFNHLLIAQLRGFNSIEEHDTKIITNWNELVTNKDEVYHLGDFCFESHEIVKSIRHRLKGKIHLILGNHDYSNRIKNIEGLFTSISDIKEIKISGIPTILCHYPMRVWPKQQYNAYHLYGHVHDEIYFGLNSLNVVLDKHELKLWSENELIHEFNSLKELLK